MNNSDTHAAGEPVALHKVRNSTLVDEVVRQVEESILSGRFQPGDKLPATRQLQTILGASLGTIREAMAILVQKGLVSVRLGSKGGFFVREPSTDTVSDSIDLLMRHMRLSPEELAEFRENVEAGMVRLVVKRAGDDEIERLLKYREPFRACLGGGARGWKKLLHLESRLRREMIAMARNRTYAAVLNPIHDNIAGYAGRLLAGSDAYTQEAYEVWMDILDALENRDADRAARRTQDMIRAFQSHIEEEGRFNASQTA